MERVWIAISILCLIAAAFFWLGRGNLDQAFVAAALGLVVWFLSLRNRLRSSNIERDNAEFGNESNLDHDEN
ncbi:MAG: hypothetical protein ACR2LC_11985 [Pyrinomonadaceae bacterium]